MKESEVIPRAPRRNRAYWRFPPHSPRAPILGKPGEGVGEVSARAAPKGSIDSYGCG